MYFLYFTNVLVSCLPVSPVAFGEETSGPVHKENLFARVGSVVHFFYKHQIAKFGDKKTILTQKVCAWGDKLNRRGIKSLDASDLTTYEITAKPIGKKFIRVDKSTAQEIAGKDTLYHLKSKSTSSNSAGASTKQTSKKRKATENNDKRKSQAPLIPRRKKPVSYQETEEDEEEEEGEVDERKPAAKRRKNPAIPNNTSTELSDDGDSDNSSHGKAFYMELCEKFTKKRNKDKAKMEVLRERIEELEKQVRRLGGDPYENGRNGIKRE